MESIITTFHIDWHLIVAQLINFGLVVVVLWWFALKPLTKVMAERTTKIENSLKQAEEIQQKLTAAETEKTAILKAGRQEAQTILAETKKLSEQQQQKTINETQAKVKKIVEESKQQIAQSQQQMLKEVKSQVADLVIAASQKVLADVSDKKIDQSLVANALKALPHQTKK